MMSSPTGPRVAVIGGGISGLVCAARLGQLGINNTTVFDTGKRAPGGRCSSRNVQINGHSHVFDHSAQYFTVSDPAFGKIVSFLHGKGAIKIWKGPIGHLKKGRRFHKYPDDYQAFVGTSGMESLSECLSSIVNVQRPVWIGYVSWNEAVGKWEVDRHGLFDYLIIAHNGKCADRLMSDAGAPRIHELLRVRFSDRVNPRDERMQLCSLWALMVAFPQPLRLPYQGAHIDDEEISWIANNTEKFKNDSSRRSDHLECWTIFSTRRFGTANKVPQENIPPKKAELITRLLLAAFKRITGIDEERLKPVFSKVQLWGAAVPMNCLKTADRCVFDSRRNVGVCGDWLVTPCIQGAALSGLALAEKVKAHVGGQRQDCGLNSTFHTITNEAVGDFPTHPGMKFTPKGTGGNSSS